MYKVDVAKEIADKCRKHREEEHSIYSQFVETSKAHNLSIRVGDTVLYVEDDPTTVNMFKSLLNFACNDQTCEKMRVVPVQTPMQAKAFIENNYMALKCVVLDLNLDVGDGEALLDWIVARFKRSLPVIIYSGDAARINDIREKYGFVEVLIKGDTTSNLDLVEAVRRNRSCEVDGEECSLPSCGKCKKDRLEE